MCKWLLQQVVSVSCLYSINRVTATTPLPFPTLSVCWFVMVAHCLACISPLVRRLCLWEALPRPQHLSGSHIHSGALDIPGAQRPVLLWHQLYHSAVLQRWGQAASFHLYSCMSLRCWKDTWDSMVKEAALSRHHHHVPTVHVHSSGGVLSADASQEEDGWLPKTIRKDNRKNSEEVGVFLGHEDFLSYMTLLVQ